jgi:hypothetical protein
VGAGGRVSRWGFYTAPPRRAIVNCVRSFRAIRAIVVACLAIPSALHAQTRDSLELSPNYWPKFTLGVTTSILLHEAAHLGVALAVGSKPTFGFDALRPTVYSGINSHVEPHKQYLFSVAGLTMQSLIDEGILDIPHHRGSAFERGLLGGGIGTTVFYLTIGRTGSVSDIVYIARMHGMTKTQSTLVFGGVAAMHTLRIVRDAHYANFFARPRLDGGMDVGFNIGPR